MAALILPEIPNCWARALSRDALPWILDDVVKRIEDRLDVSRVERLIKTKLREIGEAESVADADKSAKKAGFPPLSILLTLSDNERANFLFIKVDNCRATKPYVYFEVRGPDAGRWMEEVGQVLGGLSAMGMVEYPLRGPRRLSLVWRIVIAFLIGMPLWVQIVGGTIADLLGRLLSP